jgi:hypothetical protein
MPSSSSWEPSKKDWQDQTADYAALPAAQALHRKDFNTERGIIRCSA